MSSTPRLRSGYPATPATSQRRQVKQQQTPSTVGSVSSAGTGTTRSPTLPLAPENATPAGRTAGEPLIPLTLLDAPQQRLYAFAVYIALWAWKLYDWLQVVEDGEGSWVLLAKWILIDFAYLFLLPELRIPWLELSQSVVTCIYLGHVVITWMLMFLIPIPLLSWLLAIVKVLYDREISVSEHNVKVSSILNNHSLIMGKQIINILPEGTAVLNPDHEPFCLPEKVRRPVLLPIHFNATVPAEIELIRLDLKTNKEEIIKLSNREVSRVAKIVREQNADPSSDGFRWEYPVKKPGIYRLGKVLDEYKLEVQRSTQDTYVVPCPEARLVVADTSQRCTNDLSDLSLVVTGTPPLKISYSRTTNSSNRSFHFQSLQPDNFQSPLLGGSHLVAPDSMDSVDWVRPSTISVALNESLTDPGLWEYSVDRVEDAFGNVVDYAAAAEDLKPKTPGLSHRFAVKERPKMSLNGCDLRNPLKIAKGHSAPLPVKFNLAGADQVVDTSHKITWLFSPIDSLTNNGEHGDEVSVGSYSARNSRDRPLVSQPGLYTLKSVSSDSCEGQIHEPSSCLVLNPLEPYLSLRSEDISDKCAGNSIGLLVDLDLIGTPPFTVVYDVYEGDNLVSKGSTHDSTSFRTQIKFVPEFAGQYKYHFRSINDGVYKGIPLTGPDKVLQQVVKPAANATIKAQDRTITACLDSEVEREVSLYGEPPFSLEWEVIHDGKRKTERVTDIKEHVYKIKTPPLTKGGEYILALSNVQDVRQCRTFLQEQIKIVVRRQRPRAAFGLVEQRRSVTAVEGAKIDLPLRLDGQPPWTVTYQNLNTSGVPIVRSVGGPNDKITVRSRGLYKILEVSDGQCPGTVDQSASTFEVEWFRRPTMTFIETDSFKRITDELFVKEPVCEGDIDGFEVSLTGHAPYHVQYEVKYKPPRGSPSVSHRKFDAALPKAAVSLDTSKAGDYTYKFSGLEDNLYEPNKSSPPIIVQQHINTKPTAEFTKPGQAYKFCQEEQEHEDTIPIKLTGTAPYHVELEIKHQGGAGIEVYSIPGIDSDSYGIQIPRGYLRLGSQQVRIRRVRDANGCQRKYDIGGPAVQIQVYDAPSIYPLETREDYCVGERIAYTLSGTPPFDVAYDFNGRWHAKSQTTNFRRVAEKPGVFTITSISDKASECRAGVNIPKTIHPLPSVQISQGRQSRVDIHEGGEVDIHFEFWGTPPFEFTYTRSSNAKRGQKSVVLETRHDVSYDNHKVVKASKEGTYEVVAIKDKFCSFSTQQIEKKDGR